MKRFVDNKVPRYHVKNIDVMDYYFNYLRPFIGCKEPNLEKHHFIPKKISNDIEGEVVVPSEFRRDGRPRIVRLTHDEHVKAHFILNIALLQKKMFRMINTLNYWKIPSDVNSCKVLLDHIRFVTHLDVKNSNDKSILTVREAFNLCDESGYMCPSNRLIKLIRCSVHGWAYCGRSWKVIAI